jgi:hypothetical protein
LNRRDPEQRRLAKDRERTAAEERELWSLVQRIVRLLDEQGAAPDTLALRATPIAIYRKRQRPGSGGLMRRIADERLDGFVRDHAVPAWKLDGKLKRPYIDRDGFKSSIEYDLYLDSAGTVHAMRGMSQREWQRGVIIGDAFTIGQSLPEQTNYAEVRTGLARLAARLNLL